MFIPKDRMKIITSIIDAGLLSIGIALTDDEMDVVNQLADVAALVANGDASFLEVSACYSCNPSANIRPSNCDVCGVSLTNKVK
jgi:hypothetical protein